MSIRLRLSLLYSGILALTLVALSIVLYTTQSQFTLNWLKQDMIISSNTLGQSILRINFESPPRDDIPQNGMPPPPIPFIDYSKDRTFQQLTEGEIIRVLDASGNLVASPFGESREALPLSLEGLNVLRNNQEWWQFSELSGYPILIYNRPVSFQGRLVSILQVARSLKERNLSLENLQNTLIMITALVTLIAFGMGWLLSGITLQPIHKITRTAQTIGQEQNFSRRVNYSGPPDEVGQLAVTFNNMLAQLQDAYQKTAHALEMQRNFVADVSHELRTPLTTLRGNLGLLGRSPSLPAEEQNDILKDMVEESDRLIRLVNDLLVLARADARRNLANEAVLIKPLAEECIRQARQLAPERTIKMQVEDEIKVKGDRDALKQVLLILLDNAIKHSGGEISLFACNDSEQVLIKVIDQGDGIPPEKLAHVFERFYRANDLRPGTGFGLGLPIARALVEAQAGAIHMLSETGKGCEVIISFPLP
ncbi:MAG: ATP-binding protein [Anaerolineae bacterium]|nr:ATP-binding protein [Anaerolineae bacterium]